MSRRGAGKSTDPAPAAAMQGVGRGAGRAASKPSAAPAAWTTASTSVAMLAALEAAGAPSAKDEAGAAALLAWLKEKTVPEQVRPR